VICLHDKVHISSSSAELFIKSKGQLKKLRMVAMLLLQSTKSCHISKTSISTHLDMTLHYTVSVSCTSQGDVAVMM